VRDSIDHRIIPTPRGTVSEGEVGVTDVSPSQIRSVVPVRTIPSTIGLVLATVALLAAVVATRQVLTWIIIAGVFAVALYPAVEWLRRHTPRCRRSVATLVVFLTVLLAPAGIAATFVVPLAQEGPHLAGQLPDLLDPARTGRGPFGELVTRTNAPGYVQQHQDRIRSFVSGLTTPAAGVLTYVVLHSVPAGLAVVVFAVIYQQVENHVLQPLISARTVSLNPLTVIVAILIAGDLAGVLGTLLAIPAASMVQTIARDLWTHRRGAAGRQESRGSALSVAAGEGPSR
jgi:predicted PurR-regulated permease PerM